MKVYIVGGCVRDKLLGRTPKDIDYVVVGATDQQMLDLGFSRVGADFSVYLHPLTGDEYALARKERKVAEGHTGFETDVSTSVTLEQDLIRRDITINAMAMEVLNWSMDSQVAWQYGELIDPYGGQLDIKAKILRHVSEAFAEDPLRVLRIARFAARYKFSIAPETMLLMQKIAHTGQLLQLSSERIYGEIRKAIQEPFFHLFLFYLYKSIQNSGLNHYFYPNYYVHCNDLEYNELFTLVPNDEYIVPLRLSLLDYSEAQLDLLKVPNKDRIVSDWVHDERHEYVVLLGFNEVLSSTIKMQRFVRTLMFYRTKDNMQLVKRTLKLYSDILADYGYPYQEGTQSVRILRLLANTNIIDNMYLISSKDIENIDQYQGGEIAEQIMKLRAQFLLDMLS